MALEAGEVLHQVFAAVRIWQLKNVQKLSKHAEFTAARIFGTGRWKACELEADATALVKKNPRDHLLALCFAVLESSGFVDDPSDQNRTMNNMKLASIHYADEWMKKMENWPIFVENKKDPKSRVGIEQHFDVVLEFGDGRKIRYIGTIDGLNHSKPRGMALFLDENKSAIRLDVGWKMAFYMSHQITGYCAASTTVFGFPVFDVRVNGLKVKPSQGEDVYTLETKRSDYKIQEWGRWMRHSVEMYERYENDWENAPLYTHSCNRFFRPCSLLSFCDDSPEGRKEQWDQMVPASWSPSERAVLGV
jgi:hypothetical protein